MMYEGSLKEKCQINIGLSCPSLVRHVQVGSRMQKREMNTKYLQCTLMSLKLIPLEQIQHVDPTQPFF